MSNLFHSHPGNSGSLINHDLNALDNYRLARKKRAEQEAKIEEINNIKQDVQSLKGDVDQIKNMLQMLLERSK